MSGIRYFTGCSNPTTEAAAATEPRLGMLAQPGNALHRRQHHFDTWGIDCGVFGHARQVAKGRRAAAWGDDQTAAYLDYLHGMDDGADTLRFAVTPDVLRFVCLTHDVADTARTLSCKLAYERKPDANGQRCQGVPIGDAAATWKQSKPLFAALREAGVPAALVAQDGCTTTPIRWNDFDVLFLGGSDEMKLGAEGREITRRARAHGKWVHMGRVNSEKRLRYAAAIGCDSADGTYIGFAPDKNLPRVLDWLDATRPELTLFEVA